MHRRPGLRALALALFAPAVVNAAALQAMTEFTASSAATIIKVEQYTVSFTTAVSTIHRKATEAGTATAIMTPKVKTRKRARRPLGKANRSPGNVMSKASSDGRRGPTWV